MSRTIIITSIICLISLICCESVCLAETTFEVIEFREDLLNQKALVSGLKDMDANLCAILRIESDVAENLFVTDVKSYKTEQVSSGIIEAYISYRDRNITLAAKGVMPLRYKIPQAMEKGKVYILRVKTIGDGVKRIQESAEIKLNYSPEKDEQVYGGLDGDVNLIDFAEGARILKPSPGAHTIRLNSMGRIWEKRCELTANQKIDETVEFTDAKKEVWDIGKPGALYIETTPPGAKVFLNQVEQGLTPLDLKSVQPGNYQIDLAKDLYLPESRSIEVKSLSYEKLQIALTSNYGKVKIDSDPPGATVWINDQQRGATPLEIPQINAGSYTVKVYQNLYYEERETFDIKSGGEFVKSYSLRPQFGSINLTSVPTGAEVTAQGVHWGKTPLTRDKVPSGEHLIKLILPDYFESEQTIHIEDGMELKKEVTLQPSVGWLTVTSEPVGATVTNSETGMVLGKTPINELALNRGTYQLSIDKDQYEKYETVAGLTYGGKQTVAATLVRSVGHLQVSTTPQGAKIFLNGTAYGETPVILRDIPTGNYKVRLVRDGFDIDIGELTLNRNEVAQYSRALRTEGTVEWKKRRMNAVMLSTIVPSGGQFMSKRYIKGVLFGGAFIACIVGATDAANNHETYKAWYDTDRTAYLAANDQATLDHIYSGMQYELRKMDEATTIYYWMIAGATGIYALQLADAWYFGGGEKPVAKSFGFMPAIHPYASASTQRTMIGVAVCFR